MKKILIVMSVAAGSSPAAVRRTPMCRPCGSLSATTGTRPSNTAPTDTATLIGLPYPYTVPTAGAMFREMYYWDTFFTNEGLVRDGHPELAKGNTDNLLHMVRRFGKVYNGSRTYYEARSQTPYLSMMVDRIYRLTGDKQWLADAYETLKDEYGFWMRERLTPTGLNRYGSSASDALVDEFLVTGSKRLGTDLFDKGYTPNGCTNWVSTSSPKPNPAGTSTRATTAGARISVRWILTPTCSCTK
ncbi:MAG: trehalase family glycosidase [Alistipes onderdonkii]